ncbi:MAG: hypothetical protein LBD13_08230 [Spirochaetaceae bacterium]|jgi:hypothetical protein|nr:hypothetical protein [Spirochaetaceae bacterium]
MLEIRENQIEDIFATQLDEVKQILSINESLTLIERQKKVDSGRIDLLFLSASSLHLLELKAVASKIEFCEQTMRYRKDLLCLQAKNLLPSLPLKSYLVCPRFTDSHKQYCVKHNIIPVEFSPYELLKNYYFKVKAIANLITIKPSNHGLWNLHLLNPIIYAVKEKSTLLFLSKTTGKSKSTVGSYLRLACELCLVEKSAGGFRLTGLGQKYVSYKEEGKGAATEQLNDKQIDLLKEYIVKNPFASPAIYGVYMAVESIFLLSKNYYPVPLDSAYGFFAALSGKQHEWAEKTAADAFCMYSNYALDLGLLAKIACDYYITPSGIRFILLLELNKSILFVNAL